MEANKIYFDMDGTIADLYSVKGWLPMLRAENPEPYAKAHALVNLSRLARSLNGLRANGVEVCVVSWGSKESSDDYLKKVEHAKREWLAKHMPSVTWDEIHVLPYGTPKSCVKTKGAILFDDEIGNRQEWGTGAYNESEIFGVLNLVKKSLKRARV